MSLTDYKLILGGGGARGFAHIGVLKTLHGIRPPKRIAGCSMGAVVASVYALYKDPEVVRSKIEYTLNKTEFKRVKIDKFSKVFSSLLTVSRLYRKNYLIKNDIIMKMVNEVIPEGTKFSDLSIPLELACFDMKTGKPVFIKEGDLVSAIVASASIPGIVEPVEREDMVLTDGGVVGSLPYYLRAADMKNILVDVSYDPKIEYKFSNALEFFYKTVEWQIYYFEKNLRETQSDKKDLLLTPPVKRYTLKHFFHNDDIIEKGFTYSGEEEENIRKFLKSNIFTRMKKFLKP